MYTQMIYDAYSVIVLRVANADTHGHSHGVLPHRSSSKRGMALKILLAVVGYSLWRAHIH